MTGAMRLKCHALNRAGFVPGDEKVALNVVRKMWRINNFGNHALGWRPSDHIAPLTNPASVLNQHGDQLADLRAVAFYKGLPPIANGKAPGVCTGDGSVVAVQLQTLGAKTPAAVFVKALNAPRRLNPGKTVQSLVEKQLAARCPGKRVKILMGVSGAKPGENHTSGVGLIITVGVTQVD